MATLKAVRGTRDLLPPETELWNRVEATARAVFARYGFGEIRTPEFEATELFARGVGEETDIVSKEMYTWEDRGRADSGGSDRGKGQSLTLRPENTAGVVRAYIEHKLADTGMLQKLFYIGPQFRRERPQRGRYRQFWQIGAEVLGPPWSGADSALRDAEVLEMLATFLNEVGVRGWQLTLNSVGSSTDRPRYIAALKEALEVELAQTDLGSYLAQARLLMDARLDEVDGSFDASEIAGCFDRHKPHALSIWQAKQPARALWTWMYFARGSSNKRWMTTSTSLPSTTSASSIRSLSS